MAAGRSMIIKPFVVGAQINRRYGDGVFLPFHRIDDFTNFPMVELKF